MNQVKLTPMMKQYLEIKKQHPDCLLFYRLGDFYELFFEDAEIASSTLNLVLTSRSKGDAPKVPMCGIPFHAYENYLVRLVKEGYKVAICEQTESPEEAKKRGSTAIVKREVIRIVTAGTLLEDSLLEAKKHNYLTAVSLNGNNLAIAWADLSTGEFKTQKIEIEQINSVLTRLDAAEILISENFFENHPNILNTNNQNYTFIKQENFSFIENKELIENRFKNIAIQEFDRSEISAAGVLLSYINHTQQKTNALLQTPSKIITQKYMEIDASTRTSLEITTSVANNKNETSLFKTIDYTKTPMGGRKLFDQISNPLTDINEINERLDKIEFFIQNPILRDNIREILKTIPDIERSMSRILLGHSNPKDLLFIANGLNKLPEIQNIINKNIIPQSLTNDLLLLGEHSEIVQEIQNAIKNEKDLPSLTRTGGFINMGYSAALDELLMAKSESKTLIAKYQEKYTRETNFSNLKIGYNNIIGYYIEAPIKYAETVLNDKTFGFIHKQSTLNTIRFTTTELIELENKISHAEQLSLDLELEIFESLVNMLRSKADNLIITCNGLANIDVACALAYNAEINNWTRPILKDDLSFEITNGRHPVVEKSLKKNEQSFIPNNCNMAPEKSRLWILTGPNMAGKSTFLRQNAIISILAQSGNYVPADHAKIGIIDKLYSRVGASDDLARGRSTFMVEMVEVATILNNATERSLIILDEVGRGTATFDGLSIAWAVLEYLNNYNKCRGLFATHYHELTALANKMENIALYSMRVKEWKGDIVFLHEVAEGAVDRSYGIHVGKLAGLPQLVITRAEQILEQLEEKKQNQQPLFDDLPLFSQALSNINKQTESPVLKELSELDLDSLSPKEALNQLYHLKSIMEK